MPCSQSSELGDDAVGRSFQSVRNEVVEISGKKGDACRIRGQDAEGMIRGLNECRTDTTTCAGAAFVGHPFGGSAEMVVCSRIGFRSNTRIIGSGVVIVMRVRQPEMRMTMQHRFFGLAHVLGAL